MIKNTGIWTMTKDRTTRMFGKSINEGYTQLLTERILGLDTDEKIIDFFGEEDKILATIAKDPIKNADEALREIYKKLKTCYLISLQDAILMAYIFLLSNQRLL